MPHCSSYITLLLEHITTLPTPLHLYQDGLMPYRMLQQSLLPDYVLSVKEQSICLSQQIGRELHTSVRECHKIYTL